MKLGLGVTLEEADRLLADRAAGLFPATAIDFLNIGCRADETPPDRLGDRLAEAGVSVVIHTVELNLATTVSEEALTGLRRQADRLGARWLEQDIGVWMWGQMYLGAHLLNPIGDSSTLKAIVENVDRCSEILGRPMMIENPPVYYHTGDWDLFDMLAEVATRTGAGLILDMGHMIGYGVNAERTSVPPPPEWSGWSRVVELHLSGQASFEIHGRPVWIDRHDRVFEDEMLDQTRLILERIGTLVPLCLEMDGAPAEIADRNVVAVRDRFLSAARKDMPNTAGSRVQETAHA